MAKKTYKAPSMQTVERHTPGPWTWRRVPLPGKGSSPFDVADVLERVDHGKGTSDPVLRHEAATWFMDESDAALIAAAPELLEALEGLLEEHTDCLHCEVCGPAHRAIAKARGE